jgi:hypothetical protein
VVRLEPLIVRAISPSTSTALMSNTENGMKTTNATNAQPQLALDVKRVRKLVRTGVQGGGLNAGHCDYCSIVGWGHPKPGQ